MVQERSPKLLFLQLPSKDLQVFYNLCSSTWHQVIGTKAYHHHQRSARRLHNLIQYCGYISYFHSGETTHPPVVLVFLAEFLFLSSMESPMMTALLRWLRSLSWMLLASMTTLICIKMLKTVCDFKVKSYLTCKMNVLPQFCILKFPEEIQ